MAATRPFDDFDVNAIGTLNVLEAAQIGQLFDKSLRALEGARRFVSSSVFVSWLWLRGTMTHKFVKHAEILEARRACPEAPFVHMSTNKVYGDAPNRLNLVEQATRWDFADPEYADGIKETFQIDNSMHSIFGSSKAAADVMVQEYGRYFEMPTCCLRGGCLTGPNHSGVELDGFLSYLVRCNLEGLTYKVFGCKGKQVRDNIHSWDVAQFMNQFIHAPRSGEVYNLGGGRGNSISILEAFSLISQISGKKVSYEYIDQNRKGDYICYISDLGKMKSPLSEAEYHEGLACDTYQIYKSWVQRCAVSA